CLEKDPQRRFTSAAALADDLERWLRREPVLTRPCSTWERALKWMKRKPAIAGLSAVVALVALIGLTGIVYEWRRAEQRAIAAALAEAQAEKERERAQDKENEAKTTLATSDFLQAIRLIAEGKNANALSYLARSLSQNPTNDAA